LLPAAAASGAHADHDGGDTIVRSPVGEAVATAFGGRGATRTREVGGDDDDDDSEIDSGEIGSGEVDKENGGDDGDDDGTAAADDDDRRVGGGMASGLSP
jgi:hypothetical protein